MAVDMIGDYDYKSLNDSIRHRLMNANSISLDVTQHGLEHLQKKAVGQECELSSVKLNVTANDGKTLTGDIVGVEPSEEYAAEETPAPEPKSKPMAVIAIGMGKPPKE